jgi:hypothetical protein
MHKRNRTPQQKIDECLDEMVKNLHPNTRERMYQELVSRLDISGNVARAKVHVVQCLKLPEMGTTIMQTPRNMPHHM